MTIWGSVFGEDASREEVETRDVEAVAESAAGDEPAWRQLVRAGWLNERRPGGAIVATTLTTLIDRVDPDDVVTWLKGHVCRRFDEPLPPVGEVDADLLEEINEIGVLADDLLAREWTWRQVSKYVLPGRVLRLSANALFERHVSDHEAFLRALGRSEGATWLGDTPEIAELVAVGGRFLPHGDEPGDAIELATLIVDQCDAQVEVGTLWLSGPRGTQ